MRGMLVYKNSLSLFFGFPQQWNLHLRYERFKVTSHIVISLNNSQFIKESLYILWYPDRWTLVKWQLSEMMTIWRRFRTFYTQYARRILSITFLGQIPMKISLSRDLRKASLRPSSHLISAVNLLKNLLSSRPGRFDFRWNDSCLRWWLVTGVYFL